MGGSREVVRSGYDSCGPAYAASRNRLQSQRRLEDLVSRLAEGSAVLDLGCGSGQPIDAFLIARGLRVTGIDIAGVQISLAQATLPDGTFINADMSEVAFRPDSFDAVVSFYA